MIPGVPLPMLPNGGAGSSGGMSGGFDVVAPAATGVAATDTANLQAAINSTPAGGWLYIPRGTYKLNAALSVTNNIRITGSGVYEIYTGNSPVDTPWASPYLTGTVLVQTAAATDIIDITGTAITVHLSDFGMMFDTSIWFSNTGHGITAKGAIVGGHSYHDQGIVKSVWRNLTVFGHDGNHYAYNFINPTYLSTDTLRFYGGGGFSFVVDNPTVNYGNSVISHPYGTLMTAGSASGFFLQGANTGTFGALNLMVFIRPQCLSEDLTSHFPASTKPTSSQYLWFTDQTAAVSGASYVRDIRVINPDLEGDVGGVTSPIQFNESTFVDASGTMDAVAYMTTPDYNTTALPTCTVQGGAGSGATASINGGPPAPSDLAGLILLQSGTSPGTGAFTDVVQVTFGTPLFRDPKYVMLFPLFCSTSIPFMIHSSNKNGFMVMVGLGSVISASSTYQIAYLVVQ